MHHIHWHETKNEEKVTVSESRKGENNRHLKMDSSQIKTKKEDNKGKMSGSEGPICAGQKLTIEFLSKPWICT